MLISFMKRRELRKARQNCEQFINSFKTSNVNRQNSINQQRLTTLFPALGSINSVIILGITYCGRYIMTIDGSYIKIHALNLFLRWISVSHLKQRLSIRSVSETTMCNYALVEVIYLKATPLRLLTSITVSLVDILMNDPVWFGKVQIFSNGSAIYTEKLDITIRNNALYTFGISGEDAAVVVNSGPSLHFYLCCDTTVSVDGSVNDSGVNRNECMRRKRTEYIRQSEENMAVFSSACGLEVFGGQVGSIGCGEESGESASGSSSNWHSHHFNDKSFEGEAQEQANASRRQHDKNEMKSEECIGVWKSSFDLERFMSEAIAKMYPLQIKMGGLFDLEQRIVGPCDSCLEYLMVICATYSHNLTGQQSRAFLCFVSPWTGAIGVAKVCDLAELCTTEAERYEKFRRSMTRKHTHHPMSWLSVAADFYSAIVSKAYANLLYAGAAAEETRCFDVLSNWAMVMDGSTLRALPHPFLPVEIVHCEEGDE